MKSKRPYPRPALCAMAPELDEPVAPAPHSFATAPMGELLSFAPSPAAGGRCPKPLLAELLVLNEEMIAQLRAERLSVAGTADFVVRMIAQHERAAALLRAQLEFRGFEPV